MQAAVRVNRQRLFVRSKHGQCALPGSLGQVGRDLGDYSAGRGRPCQGLPILMHVRWCGLVITPLQLTWACARVARSSPGWYEAAPLALWFLPHLTGAHGHFISPTYAGRLEGTLFQRPVTRTGYRNIEKFSLRMTGSGAKCCASVKRGSRRSAPEGLPTPGLLRQGEPMSNDKGPNARP